MKDEYNSRPLPPETTPPPPEYRTPAAEITPPPPEFGAKTAAAKPGQTKKRRWRRLLAVPAVVLLGFLVFKAASTPAPQNPAVSTEPNASGSEQTEPSEAPTEEPPEETTVPYPIEDREMLITVYTGTLDENYEFVVLLQQRMNESEFTGLELAAPEEAEGFSFYGYVIHTGNPWLRPEEEPPGTQRAVISIGQTLTVADVEQTPVAADGVRYVDIYANWISNVDPMLSEQVFILDDGMGHEKAFDGSSPMYSEGFLYVEAYPETEREGYVFEGYYNEAGERVYALQSYMDFFEPSLYDENGNVIDVDMSKPRTVRLTARWKPAEN